jgi:hypothetical protein
MLLALLAFGAATRPLRADAGVTVEGIQIEHLPPYSSAIRPADRGCDQPDRE